MANQYNSKIVLSDGTTLLDLTGDTVTAANLRCGETAHGADGAPVIGTAVGYAHDTGNLTIEIQSDVNAVLSTGDLTNAFEIPGSTLDFVPRMMMFFPYNATAAGTSTPKDSAVRCTFFSLMLFDETGAPLSSGWYTMYSQPSTGTNAISMVNSNLGFYYLKNRFVYAYNQATAVTTNAVIKANRWRWRAWG